MPSGKVQLLDLVMPVAVAFVVTMIATVSLRGLGHRLGLVDRPGGRKRHEGIVPVVGGFARLVGLCAAFGVASDWHKPGLFLVCCAALVVFGALDDRFQLSPSLRLLVQSFVAGLAALGGGILATTLGDPLGLGPIMLPTPWAEVATFLLIVGAINAFNMVDGVDGLAGIMAAAAFMFLTLVSAIEGLVTPFLLASVGFGMVCGFLVFNAPTLRNRALRCFMGDSGSTLLGFVLAWLCLEVSQSGRSSMTPMAVLWFVALPVYELLWTILRRAARGRSPLSADRGHFHHRLQDAGFSVRAVFCIYLAVCLVLGCVGLLLHDWARVGDPVSFLCWVLTGVGVVFAMSRAEALRQRLLGTAAPPAG